MSDIHALTCVPANRRTPKPLSFVADMFATYRQRHALKALDASALADLGLSADDAQSEANRPIWDVPAAWRG
jgi:uncharacterized protein YjiS (DUF1127 family)